MNSRIAQRPLQNLSLAQGLGLHGTGAVGHFTQFNGLGVVFLAHGIAQFFIVYSKNLVQAFAVGHGFGEAVCFGKGKVQDPGGVFDGTFGRHGAVGDNLGHLAGAVLVDNVLDDLVAAAVVKIDVDIGEGNTVGIQKALEQEVVPNGVYVRDADAVGHRRTGCRAAPRPHTHPHIPGGSAEILHNQKIPRIAGFFDGCQLKIQSLLDLVGPRTSVPALGTFQGEVAQIGILPALPSVLFVLGMHKLRWNLKFWEQHFPGQGKRLHPAQQVLQMRKSLGQIGKRAAHFGLRGHVETVVGHSVAESPSPPYRCGLFF